ncbi:MAG TPA: carboxypeptidase-like regulatory domain-containing protein [Longimicrobiaceae bacterium]|nr:carboxypeptidase-like regulatory domain-containing protein [Longimicrobiaceae bacterium]
MPPGYEQGIFEIFVSGLPPVSVPSLLAPEGKVLLPLHPVLELTGAPFQVDTARARITVARPRGVGTAWLDLPQKALQGAKRVALAPDDAATSEGEIYLSTGRIADLLEAQVEVDLGTLRVILSREPPFPRQERLSIQERRELELILGRGTELRPRPLSVPFHPRTGGGVLEWGVSSLFPDPVIPSHVYARVGLGVLGGMLQLGANANARSAGEPALGEVTGSYLRVFPESNLLRQFRIGDIVTEGLRARSIRGVSVTNAPFARDALFGEAIFAPHLPPGWEYELYQNGRLLGFSDAASQSPLAVPLQYGSTPVQVRLYGPAGERVVSEVVYLVPVLQIPAGRWQYATGAGACPRDECESVAYFDLRHGATRWLTLLGGVDRLDDTAGVTYRPYTGASILPAPAWVAEVQTMHRSFVRASVQNYGAGKISGGASAGIAYPGSGAVSFLPTPGKRWHLDTTLRLRLQGTALNRSLDLSGRVEGPLQGAVDRWRLTVATGVRRVLVETAYESNVTESGDILFLRGTAAISRGLPRWLEAPVVSAAAGVGASGLRQWELSTTIQPAGTILSLTARGHAGTRSPSLLIGSTIRLGFGRAQARVGTRNGRAEGGIAVDGGVAFGEQRGVTPLPFGGMGQAGVSGEVFQDLDGNGVRGPGDPPVPDVYVGVGGLRTRTGGTGRFATWSVLPYEVVQVRVDTTTLPDPSWVPATPSVLLRPSPHVYSRVDFPLVRTRELAGVLVGGEEIPTVGGVTVEIVQRSTGEVQRIPTFSDGEYYITRLRPGEYEIRVASSSLQALGARAEPESVRVDVPFSGDNPLVEAPPIQLLKRTP